MKDIKDYLHLYLGCECEVPAGIIGPLISVGNYGFCTVTAGDMGDHYFKYEEVKPLLRPLSDMTEEERIEVASMVSPGEDPMWVKHIAMTTKWYLSKGFDLFGLIEAGLAIDKTDRN